ncbi:MAG: transcription antitermination factor NusB [Clostridiales bacterium]|nr:transcription antitermination factor NusB [Clostridiales bacterium]
MSLSSSQIREQAFYLIFDKEFNSDLSNEDILNLAYETDVIEKNQKCEKLFITCCNNAEEIDDIINKYSVNRRFSRISKVALAVLRIAVCELKFFTKTPERVVISEAVILTKKYGGEEDYSFVNGILKSFVDDRKATNDSSGD